MTYDPHGAVDPLPLPLPPAVPCHFAPGDHIRSTFDHAETAQVTELTAAGFRYTLDRPHALGRVAWGQITTGGECLVAGYFTWEKVPSADEIISTPEPLTLTSSVSSSFYFGSSNGPAMTLPASRSCILAIHDALGDDLLRIENDGSVTTFKLGCETEAARVFYEALSYCGVSLVSRVKDLEKRLAHYEPVEEAYPWPGA